MSKLLNWLCFLFAASISFNALSKEGEAITPIPSIKTSQNDSIRLGQRLYNDAIFSRDFSRSCASCHSFSKAGTDGLPQFKALNNQKGTLNTPTVFNANLNFRQFWNGRSKNLEQVVDDHLKDLRIFANDWPTLLSRIADDSELIALYAKAYPGKVKTQISQENIKNALKAYLTTLYTPDSPFDRYLKGDENALSSDAKIGYKKFIEYGCITCHEGPNMGGNLFQKMGVYKNYYTDPSKVNPSDLGLYNVTKKNDDKFVFKVPSLRNVTLTAPYMHDGSINDLDQMIQIMAIYQVGQPIPEFDVKYIIKFLEALNGKQPAANPEEETSSHDAQSR